jgi:hypothetical protein
MGLHDWIAQLKVGDRVAVYYDVAPGSVCMQRVQAIVEPGDPFGEGVAEERYVLGTLDHFDGLGQGWRVDFEDDTSDRLVVKKTFARIEPPTPESIFRDWATEVLECAGVEWGRLPDEQLRQVLTWLEAAGAVPADFVPV